MRSLAWPPLSLTPTIGLRSTASRQVFPSPGGEISRKWQKRELFGSGEVSFSWCVVRSSGRSGTCTKLNPPLDTDQRAMVGGLRFLRRLFAAPALAKHIVE